MDGRIVRILLTITAGLLVGIATATPARAQAMGKVTVDSSGLAPAPARTTAAPATPKTPDSAGFAAPTGIEFTGSVTSLTPSLAIASAPSAPSVSPVAAPAASTVAAAPVAPAPVAERNDAPTILPPASPTPTAATNEPAASADGTKTSSPLEQSSIRHPTDTAAGTTLSPMTPARTGWGNLAQVATALVVVVGLIFIGRALVRKFVPGAGVPAGKGVIEILARHPLAKNQSLVLVRIGSQIVALNQGRESSESVLVISDATEVAKIIGQIEGKNPNSISAGFNNLLANARMDLEQNGDAEDKTIDPETLDEQLEEMAAAKRQLMELRQHVRSVRDSLPT